jgi:16S rRNA (cytosine967-C5)-methyltransferase
MLVIDACAGAGGKTLHLAALMRNEGELWAFDSDGRRLEELRRRARRAGATIVRSAVADAAVRARWQGLAERVLLDVPCSGLGTLRRQPDLKWRLRPERLGQLAAVQARLLDEGAAMVAPGGLLVYATCSILPAENRLQVEGFLARTEDFRRAGEEVISPAASGWDGFYVAVLERRSPGPA